VPATRSDGLFGRNLPKDLTGQGRTNREDVAVGSLLEVAEYPALKPARAGYLDLGRLEQPLCPLPSADAILDYHGDSFLCRIVVLQWYGLIGALGPCLAEHG
jgi:hypothetical protein